MVLEPAGAGELVERRLGQLMAWLPDLISGTEASPGHLPQGITVFSLVLIFRVRGFFLEIVPGACVQLCHHLGVCVGWGGALIPKFRAGQALQSREELGRPPGCQRSLPRALGMVTAAGNQDVRFEPSKQSRLREWTATGQPGFKFQLCHFLAMSSWINY